MEDKTEYRQEVEMYEQFFNFSASPFKLIPSTDHYFAADAIHGALKQTISCIQRASGPATVIGPTGTGKTLLLQMLERQFRDQFTVVNLGAARCEKREDLLQAILFEIGEPFRQMPEGELRLGLMDFLRPSPKCENGILLLIDDAESLGNPLLDEVRLITNVVRNGQPRCRLVMAGGARLEENLMNSKLESFNQRIAGRYYLENLSRDETRSYILAHLERAGRDGTEIFAPDTFRLISELTDGCPRLINQLCENALALAANLGRTQIDVEFVDYAWKDVQNIPASAPQQETFAKEPAVENDAQTNSLVIEFGSLDDDGAGNEDEVIHAPVSMINPGSGSQAQAIDSGRSTEPEPADDGQQERADGGAIVLRRSATTTVFDLGSDKSATPLDAIGYDGVDRRQRATPHRRDAELDASEADSLDSPQINIPTPSIPVFDATTGEVFGKTRSAATGETPNLVSNDDQELDVAQETLKANQELESDFESLGNKELASDPAPVEKRIPGSFGIANQERLQHVLGGIFEAADGVPAVDENEDVDLSDVMEHRVSDTIADDTTTSQPAGFANRRLPDGSIQLEETEDTTLPVVGRVAESEDFAAKQPATNFDIVASIERGPKKVETAANPFDESFESEEEVQATVQPTFAQQNLSSLNVTREQLKVLNSISTEDQRQVSIPRETEHVDNGEDAAATKDKRAISAEGFAELLKSSKSQPSEKVEATEKQPVALNVASDGSVLDAAQDPFAVQSWDVVAADPPQTDQPAQSLVSSVEAISTFEATASSSFGDVEDPNGEPGFVVDQAYIERRADEVLRSLGELEEQCEQVEASENANVISIENSLAAKEALNQQASEYQAVERERVEQSQQEQVRAPQSTDIDRDLKESADVLNQLNRDMASLHGKGGEDTPIENLNVEYLSVDRTDSGQSVDDRDMLLVSKVNEQPSGRKSEFVPDPLAAANPSKGRAERIDYKRLFEQLRDVSENP